MLKIIKVTGESMEPEYRDGDFVLIIKLPFFHLFLKAGRDVVFRKAPYGLMIKRILKVNENKTLNLKSLNADKGLAEERLREVPFDSVQGVVVYHFG